jgi:hypothetical protein
VVAVVILAMNGPPDRSALVLCHDRRPCRRRRFRARILVLERTKRCREPRRAMANPGTESRNARNTSIRSLGRRG